MRKNNITTKQYKRYKKYVESLSVCPICGKQIKTKYLNPQFSTIEEQEDYTLPQK